MENGSNSIPESISSLLQKFNNVTKNLKGGSISYKRGNSSIKFRFIQLKKWLLFFIPKVFFELILIFWFLIQIYIQKSFRFEIPTWISIVIILFITFEFITRIDPFSNWCVFDFRKKIVFNTKTPQNLFWSDVDHVEILKENDVFGIAIISNKNRSKIDAYLGKYISDDFILFGNKYWSDEGTANELSQFLAEFLSVCTARTIEVRNQ